MWSVIIFKGQVHYIIHLLEGNVVTASAQLILYHNLGSTGSASEASVANTHS